MTKKYNVIPIEGGTDSYSIVIDDNKNIIASIYRKLPNRPLIEVEEKINPMDIAKNYYKKVYTNHPYKSQGSRDELWGFVTGYKAATKTYTEEDLVDLLEWLKTRLNFNQKTGKFHVDVENKGKPSNDKIDSKAIIKAYTKSLKKPISAVELEILTVPIDSNGNVIGTNKPYPYEEIAANFTIIETIKVDENNIIHPVNVFYD